MSSRTTDHRMKRDVCVVGLKRPECRAKEVAVAAAFCQTNFSGRDPVVEVDT